MMRWTAGSMAVRNVVTVVLLAGIAGALIYSLFAPVPRTELDSIVGVTKTSLEGLVVADPDQREKVALITVSVDGMKVLVSTDPYASVEYGDRISVEGTLEYPESFATDTGRTFDYRQYLRAKGILYTMSFANVEVLASGEGNPLVHSLIGVKHTFERGIMHALPEPQSALLAGLLLGDKRSLGEEITEDFRASGIIHIIVLSGYNVALVLQAVVLVLSRFLSRPLTYVVAAVCIVGFAVMTGASETTVRAVIMALLMMLATVLRRPKAALRGLLIAAAAMALWNPFVVLYDLSFQLSVLATLGLILFSDWIAARLPVIPRTLGLREVVATTIATQVTVLPLLILSIGQVSLVFLATNPLVLPAVPAAMLLGFIGAIVALLIPAIALPAAVPAYLVLTYIIEVGVWFGSFSFSSVTLDPEWSMVILPVLGIVYLTVFVRAMRGNVLQPPRRSGS